MATETETSPRVQRRRARNRTTMLDVAEAKFAADGIAAVRIEAIAEAADVSVGTVYGHFGNKDGLIVAVAERILDRAGLYLAQAYEVSDSPLEQVAATGAAYLHLLADFPFLIRFLSTDLATADPAVTSQITARIEVMYAVLSDRIEAAITVGQVKPLDARLLARFLFGAWNGVFSLTIQSDATRMSTDEVEQCLAQARRIIIDGIATPAMHDANGHATVTLHDVPRPAPIEDPVASTG
ncbi:TetR/AcrR family transcriptional regulator [Nocardia sp. NPDC127606]|uniref:TetR/AcrR family transcriptional regulator n=1 Tax=Nocardia sp. NPDC127606 TaxID=3345406 RepID=UPI003638D319